MGRRKEEGWRVHQSLVPRDPKDWITLVYPYYPASLDPFEWLENDGRNAKGRERERELPLIGRMIPANPEKLGWGEEGGGGSPASLCQKLEGKWTRDATRSRQGKARRIPLDRMKMASWKDESRSTRSEEFSKRKESLTLVNRGRGCFSCERWNFYLLERDLFDEWEENYFDDWNEILQI